MEGKCREDLAGDAVDCAEQTDPGDRQDRRRSGADDAGWWHFAVDGAAFEQSSHAPEASSSDDREQQVGFERQRESTDGRQKDLQAEGGGHPGNGRAPGNSRVPQNGGQRGPEEGEDGANGEHGFGMRPRGTEQEDSQADGQLAAGIGEDATSAPRGGDGQANQKRGVGQAVERERQAGFVDGGRRGLNELLCGFDEIAGQALVAHQQGAEHGPDEQLPTGSSGDGREADGDEQGCRGDGGDGGELAAGQTHRQCAQAQAGDQRQQDVCRPREDQFAGPLLKDAYHGVSRQHHVDGDQGEGEAEPGTAEIVGEVQPEDSEELCRQEYGRKEAEDARPAVFFRQPEDVPVDLDQPGGEYGPQSQGGDGR